jgi:hypothetical protein
MVPTGCLPGGHHILELYFRCSVPVVQGRFSHYDIGEVPPPFPLQDEGRDQQGARQVGLAGVQEEEEEPLTGHEVERDVGNAEAAELPFELVEEGHV